MKRGRVMLGLAFALLAGLASAAGGLAYRRAHVPWRTFKLPPIDDEDGGALDVAFVGDGQGLAIRTKSPVNAGAWAVRALETGAVVRELKGVIALPGPSTGWFLEVVKLEVVNAWTGERRAVTSFPDGTLCALSQSGDRLVGITQQRIVWICGVGRDDSRRSFVTELPEVTFGFFSPDGERLLLVNHHWEKAPEKGVVVSTGSGKTIDTIDGFDPIGFADTGELVVESRGPGSLVAAIADRVRTITEDPHDDAEVSAKGRHLVLMKQELAPGERDDARARRTVSLVVRSIASGEIVRRLSLARRAKPHCVALSPDGDKLAVLFKDGTVEVWEIP